MSKRMLEALGTSWTCGPGFIRAYNNPKYALYDCTNYDNGTGKVFSAIY